ncbi:hypothetical protein COU77_00315 [Candidatus Peregrinibacteria bacterium CG10_big_fil_rev_8_21_14_0_10_49_16]|nr:MAG: hypothetical protein COW95_01785 [Candidatus Peregrinibacteria bacterium CG22_combo_CG10-13_8_21_14_all_49_11]PIR52431.1 MAG: hypothetical protein COU77_00315 [Candidatus Peregrinibacteria bacterium CG10_big_fil_rev_8_21_14_0_10_49_16]
MIDQNATNRPLDIVKILVVLALLFAVADLPYFYYQLLRWIVCGTAAYSAYQAYEKQKTVWMWIFISLAILFNPIAPIYFTRAIWQFLDVGTAVVFCVSLFIERPKLIR